MSHRGVYWRGAMEIIGVPLKTVALKARMNRTTLAEFFHGRRDVDDLQYGRICMAIGEARIELTAGFRKT